MTPVNYCLNCGAEIDYDNDSGDWYHVGRFEGKEMYCDPNKHWRNNLAVGPTMNSAQE